MKTSSSALFQWHARQGAFERLSPPWEDVRVRNRNGSIRNGDTLDLEVRLGPIPIRWRARHQDYEEGRQFCDVQEGGPFKTWQHTHRVSEDPSGALLEDLISYELPLSLFSNPIAGRPVRAKLDRMFQYRHRTTRDDVEAHERADIGSLRVGITGASGLIGQNLSPLLTTGGHQVESLKRSGTGESMWERATLDGLDAVVHLAGESIDGRWTSSRKLAIERSRVEGTRRLVAELEKCDSPPDTLVCASAIGFYGDRGDETLDESASSGSGFLSEVCEQWEEAAGQAEARGIRVVNLRFGVVLSTRGGALRRMLPPFKLGGGGRIGSGEQYMSWVAIDDAVGAIHHAIGEREMSGPVNVVSENPVTQQEFAKTLGRVLSRPTVFPLPGFVARAAFGEMADALLLSSTRCIPAALQSNGYVFRYPDLEDALRFQLGRMPVSE